MTELEHRPTTPDDALQELLAGNERFVTGARVHPNQDAEHRAAVATSQTPFAVVFGCSDSRLAAEIIFDRGLGDLFVVRTAGHIIGPEVLASVAYGVTVLATHDAMNQGLPAPGLRAIVDRVRPSIEHARSSGVTDLDAISATHVRLTVRQLSEEHPALVDAIAAKDCAVVGLTYKLTDGRVTVVAKTPAT
jgi:carbonic anhydrase